jgi:hypothetical protein
VPRPGYEPEDDFDREDDERLIARFPHAAQDALREGLAEQTLTPAHVLQLYRVQTRMPEYRDDEALTDLVEMSARMSAEELKEWVDEQVERAEDM